MKTKNLILFGYDFPHKKTQDFIFRLITEGYKIKYCLAAPWKKLHIPHSKFRISPKNEGLIHPRQICKKLKIKYLIKDHNDKFVVNFIEQNPFDIGIIAGARILSEDIIKASGNRIINIHPGLIPESRGLDTLLWSIYNNVPIGITAHFINSKIDAGRLILREPLILKRDDTLIDVSLRLLEKQSDVLIKALKALTKYNINELGNLNLIKSKYYSKMPPDLESKTIKKFHSWVKKYSSI